MDSFSKVVTGYAKSARNIAMQVPEIKVKVYEATSNEKWGPTGSQMHEISQASYSYEHFPLIMETIWERINDDGKNWRHVYKSLLLLEYLLRRGSPDCIREARVKVIEIQTLREFQYVDDAGKDQGVSVRHKAKAVVELLHDEQRLESEREKARKTAHKFEQAISSESAYGGRGISYQDSRGGGGYHGSQSHAASSFSDSGTRGGDSRKGFGDPAARDDRGRGKPVHTPAKYAAPDANLSGSEEEAYSSEEEAVAVAPVARGAPQRAAPEAEAPAFVNPQKKLEDDLLGDFGTLSVGPQGDRAPQQHFLPGHQPQGGPGHHPQGRSVSHPTVLQGGPPPAFIGGGAGVPVAYAPGQHQVAGGGGYPGQPQQQYPYATAAGGRPANGAALTAAGGRPANGAALTAAGGRPANGAAPEFDSVEWADFADAGQSGGGPAAPVAGKPADPNDPWARKDLYSLDLTKKRPSNAEQRSHSTGKVPMKVMGGGNHPAAMPQGGGAGAAGYQQGMAGGQVVGQHHGVAMQNHGMQGGMMVNQGMVPQNQYGMMGNNAAYMGGHPGMVHNHGGVQQPGIVYQQQGGAAYGQRAGTQNAGWGM